MDTLACKCIYWVIFKNLPGKLPDVFNNILYL